MASAQLGVVRKARCLLVLAVMVASAFAPGAASAEDHDFRVQVGAKSPTNPDAPYEYTRFYPERLQVHRGQTVRWETVGNPFTGFHTVTFSKAGRPALMRADEIEGTYATPEAWAFGSECGRGTRAPCVLTEGTQFLSSGVPPFGSSPFTITFDAPLGTYNYLCTVHPAMTGEVEVVADETELPTQAEIDETVADEIESDTLAADAVFKAGQTPVSTVEGEEQQRVWRVLLGDSTADHHVSILAYLPGNLTIDRGDKVRYVYRGGVVNEIHSVTYPSAIVGNFTPPHGLGGLAFFPLCDPDDPATGARGVPGAWEVFGPRCPGTTELGISPWMTSAHPAPGNIVGTPATYHDSGLLVPSAAPASFRILPDTGEELPSTFEAEFPAPGAFSYECTVHVDPMTGGITVRP